MKRLRHCHPRYWAVCVCSMALRRKFPLNPVKTRLLKVVLVARRRRRRRWPLKPNLLNRRPHVVVRTTPQSSWRFVLLVLRRFYHYQDQFKIRFRKQGQEQEVYLRGRGRTQSEEDRQHYWKFVVGHLLLDIFPGHFRLRTFSILIKTDPSHAHYCSVDCCLCMLALPLRLVIVQKHQSQLSHRTTAWRHVSPLKAELHLLWPPLCSSGQAVMFYSCDLFIICCLFKFIYFFAL